jgi:tRNA(His) guanylyltransferase
MKFEDLDARMRVFETAHDHCVLPVVYMVVRLDGRGFTRLTKEVWNLETPFDIRFRDVMLDTTEHLFDCGFSPVYGYTQSDEISLLLRRDDATFGRKMRKLLSVLAGEASARFTLSMGSLACLDARISQLPTAALVRDYFLWRQEDAHRNALNAHCYWLLRKRGKSAQDATHQLIGLSVADKNEFLFQNSINFNDLPAWQKRGSAVYWGRYQKPAVNPKTGEAVLASRRRLVRDFELPIGEQYGVFIGQFLAEAPP